MNHILLLGAGFSRNWGGWLADELTADLMGRVSDDRVLLKHLRSSNGFEVALEEVRRQYKHHGTPAYETRLMKLQDAIVAAFKEMNPDLSNFRASSGGRSPIASWAVTAEGRPRAASGGSM
jgi:hypothetical protein